MATTAANTNKLNVAIVFHSVDWDGFTSAAIARVAVENEGIMPSLIPWTYGDPVPFVDDFDKVILVDLTISDRLYGYAWMERNASKLVWFDHHENAVNAASQNQIIATIPGKRAFGYGACKLVWEQYFGTPMPDHVALCATYDTWNKSGEFFTWKQAWAYQLGLSAVFGDKCDPTARVDEAENLIKGYISTDDVLFAGVKAEEMRSKAEEEIFKTSEKIHFDGVFGRAINTKEWPASVLKNHLEKGEHDFYVTYYYDEVHDGYKLSIRVPDNSAFDASEMAREFRGNGHVKAAGCLVTLDELKSLLK